MNDEACVLTINGSDYYYPCNYADYIKVIDNRLINTGSSSITLYSSFPVYGDNNSGYPRITAPSNTQAYIRTSYNGNYQTLNVNSFEFKYRQYTNDIYLLIVIVGVMICQLFKR